MYRNVQFLGQFVHLALWYRDLSFNSMIFFGDYRILMPIQLEKIQTKVTQNRWEISQEPAIVREEMSIVWAVGTESYKIKNK